METGRSEGRRARGTGGVQTARGLCVPALAALLVWLTGCVSSPPEESAEYGQAVRSSLSAVGPRIVDGAVGSVEAGAPELTEKATVQDYVARAALANPGLQAAFHRWKAALERIPQEEALPDPRFTYGYVVQTVDTRNGPDKQLLMLEQTFPWLRKLVLRGGVAAEAAEAERRRFDAAMLGLRYEVVNAYYERYYLGRAISVVRENLELMKYLEGVARVRYAAAEVAHPDVIRAQVEIGKLEDELRTLEDMDGPILARLNAALNRPPSSPLPWPKSAAVEPVDVDDQRLLAWMAQSSPDLQAMDRELAARVKAVSLARQEYIPDVTLSVSREPVLRESAKDPVMVALTVNLPIWLNRINAGVREAEHRRAEARRMRENRANELSTMVKMASYRLRDAERKIDLYGNTLVPKGKESLDATDTAYRAGKATFLDLVDAERVLLEFTLMRERAVADYNQRLAELEMLVGRALPRRQGK